MAQVSRRLHVRRDPQRARRRHHHQREVAVEDAQPVFLDGIKRVETCTFLAFVTRRPLITL